MISLQCSNRGCNKIQEPYINLEDDKVYCSECDQEIINITYFIKVQLKNLKQFKKKKKISFSVKCDKCSNEDRPVLINGELICKSCKKVLDKLSVSFRNMLKEKLKTVDKDV